MTTISSKIYLSSYSGPVFDQGGENSCVANAVCQAIRIQTKAYNNDSGELARNQIYYDYRAKYSNVNVDGGASLTDMLSVAKLTGVATQASAAPYGGWPMDVFVAPNASARASASSNLLTNYNDLSNWMNYKYGTTTQIDFDSATMRLNRDQQQASINAAIDDQLMHGKAVLISGEVPKWIANVDGIALANQHQYASDTSFLGRHAMVIVGRDNSINGGSYIVENSWGTGEGDRGYIAISYSFLSKGFSVTEAATIDGFDGKDATLTKQHQNVSKLYVNLLGRGADHDGLEFWAGAERAGFSMSHIANQIASSAEGTAKYGSLSNSAYVDQLFKNMTGHAAASNVNQLYVNKLASGMSRGDMGLDLMNLILSSAGADRDTLINRNTVSETLAETYQLNGHLDKAAWAINVTTSDADSVQVALTGVQQNLGWMSGSVSTYGFYG